MRKGARFCVTCGASMSEPLNHEKREHGRNSKKRNFFLTLLLCAGVGAGIFLCLMLNEPDATNVILEDSYTIEDGKIALGLLDVVYSNGKTEEIGDYTIYIDDAIFGVKNGKVNAGQLSEGEHTMKVVWRREENTYEYEKRLDIRRYSFENLEKALLEKYGETQMTQGDKGTMITGSGVIGFYSIDLDNDDEDELICLRQEQNEIGSVMNCSIYNSKDGEATCVFSLADEGKELQTGKGSEFLLTGGADPYIGISDEESEPTLFRMKEGVVKPEMDEEQKETLRYTSECILYLKENGTKFYIAGGALR